MAGNGNILTWLFGQNPGGYSQVPGTNPSDYGLVDPSGYTAGAFNTLGNLNNFSMQQLGSLGGNVAGLAGQATSYNPNAGFNQFMAQAPGLQGLLMGPQSDLQNSLTNQGNQLAKQAISDVQSAYANTGNNYSGAAQKMASQQVGNIFGGIANQLGSQQIGLYGNLLGQNLGQANQNQQFGANNFLNAAGLYGNMYGQNAALAGQSAASLGQFGNPTYAAPQYMANPSLFQQLIGPASQVASTALTGGMIGG